MKIKLPVSILVALLVAVTPTYSQDVIFKSNPAFELTQKGRQITDMTQDPHGYMWFGTDQGLYRYNGYQTSLYIMADNIAASNFIRKVYADDQGLIWCGSLFSGLDCLDPQTGVFKHFKSNSNDPAGLSSSMINDIIKDKKGFLWVATSKGLNRLDSKTGKFTRFQNDKKVPTSLSDNDVNVLYEDKKGNLWVGTEGGLNYFNAANGQFIKFVHDPQNPNSLSNNSIKSIFEDSRGLFWIGTDRNGLNIMNRATGSFQRYNLAFTQSGNPASNNSENNFDYIKFIQEDAANKIWVGTDNMIGFYDYKNNKITYFDTKNGANVGLKNSSLTSALISRDSILWISTVNGIVYQLDPYLKKIPYRTTEMDINGMHRDPTGVLWFLHYNELLRFNPRTGEQIVFKHNPKDPQSLSPLSNTMSLYKRFSVGKNNKLWIATYGYGIDCFDKSTQLTAHFRHIPGNTHSIMHDTADFVQEEGDYLWVGSTGGLDRMHLKTGKFTHYPVTEDTTGLMSNFILAVFTQNKEKIWIGSIAGLHQLNPLTGKFKYYLKGIAINCIQIDGDGVIWLGTDYGLYQYNAQTDKFNLFKAPYGKGITDWIEDIQEDEKKNLWIGSQSNLFRINPSRDYIRIFDEKDGVIKGQTCLRGFGTSGEILFIEGKGYYSITDRDVKNNPFPPQVVISDFQIVGSSSNNKVSLSDPFAGNKELVLKHYQNVFSFNILPIHYTNPAENRVLYKLEDYDTDWRPTDSEGKASYFNVPPGEYVLKVKAFNSSGASSVRTYLLTIAPPWWKTLWAYLLYALALLLSIRAYSQYRSRKLKEENLLLEEKVVHRTNELAQKSTELEKSLTELKATQNQLVQSEKLASLGELTAGIAHEIQNPLNFVNNFSELSVELAHELKEEIKKPEKDWGLIEDLTNDLTSNQEKINHHGKRASNIVKGMLEHSRISSGVKEPTDMNALIKETLPLSYHAMRAKDKSFNADYKMDLDDNLGTINIIPQDMSRVFINLFNNAFYAVHQKKQVSDNLPINGNYIPSVLVSTHYSAPPLGAGGAIVIRINDNGTGMPEGVRAKVFQPFFTTKPTGQGTGLGLSLAYDIVTKGHGGTLEVESTEGVGTEFIIKLMM